MKHLVKLLTLGAALVASPLAHATLISIGLQQTGINGGAITTVATDSGSGFASFGPSVANPTGSYGSFNFNSITAAGAPLYSQGSLQTTSMQMSSTAAGTITIYITETGLTSPTGLTSFLSSFTSNAFSGNAISVVESTLYSSGNALYDGTSMGSATFTGGGLNTGSASFAANLSGTYSETVKYVVTVGSGVSSVNDTVNITTAATPEPSSLVMLGTGLVSAAGMLVRRRRIS